MAEDSVKIIGTRPPISCHVSPIGQNIVITKKNRCSENIPDHNRHSPRKYDSLYYQPQPAMHNNRQNYFHDKIIKQASLQK